MSQENVEMLRRAYDLMWREGWVDDALVGLSETEWVVPDFEAPVRRGQGPITRFLNDWLEIFEPDVINYEFFDAGDRVVVLCDLRGRTKATGVEVDNSFGHVWTFRGGRPVRMIWCDTRNEALKAAGLREKGPVPYNPYGE